MSAPDQPDAETYNAPDPAHHASGKPLQVAFVCVIGISFIGYLVGVRTPHLTPSPTAQAKSVQPHESGVVPTLWYRDIDRGNLSPNAASTSDLADLQPPSASDLANRSNSQQDKRTALAERANRRAYFGAPPIVPHPIDPVSNASCLHCHETGLWIGDRLASPIPHAHYASCTQCHVEQNDLRSGEAWWLNNSFTRQHEATEGSRAYVGAPPTIPHDIAMRSVCLSCHGSGGRNGLRSTHTERSSCLQCHALDASLARRGGH